MTTLIKNTIAAVPGTPDTPAVPGTPFIPGHAGTPYVPATTGSPAVPGVIGHPAYYIDVVTYVPKYDQVCVLHNHTTGECVAYASVFVGNERVVTRQWFLAEPSSPYIPAVPPHAAIPAVPGTLDIPATPGTPLIHGTPGTPADYLPGWTGAANSIQTMPHSGQYIFSVPQNSVGVVTGLTQHNFGPGYADIEYGIIFQAATAQVVERGIRRGSAAGFVTSDEFTIARSGTRVSYYKNSILFYTSDAPSTGTLLVDASLYYGGDSIVGAVLHDSLDTSFDYNGCNGLLGTVAGFASDGGNYFAGLLGNIEGVALGGAPGVIEPLFHELIGFSGQEFAPTYATCYGELGEIVGDSFGLQGQSVHFEAELTQVAGLIRGLQGEHGGVTGTLQPMEEFSTNTSGGYINHPRLFSSMYPEIGVDGGAVMGRLGQVVGNPRNGNWITGYAGGYSLFAMGEWASYLEGVHAELSGYSLNARGHNVATRSIGRASLNASGTLTTMGRATCTLPRASVFASATWTQQGRMIARTGGRYTVSARGAAQDRSNLPRATVSASGTTRKLNTARARLSRPEFTGAGLIGTNGGVRGVLPGVRVVPSGLLLRTLPTLTMFASGGPTAGAAQYEGYSLLLTPTDQGELAATTHYTDYPFDRIVRFNGKYYGVAADGLYELDGDTFNGTAIVANVTTAETDFKERMLKRPVSLYMAGRMSGDMDVSVLYSETDDETIKYKADVSGGARNQRATFGKGIRARYISYEITNPSGANFEIDELAPEVDVLRRTA